MISIVVNVDTRKENFNEGGLSKGVVSRDFLTEGLLNKLDFFNGFDTELIVFIDQHEPIDEATLKTMRALADTVVIRRHTDEQGFNDSNYIKALQMANGNIIVHFDQDTAAFTNSKEDVQLLVELLDRYDFVSYPSHWSPLPVEDSSFDHTWVSTRFFMCKKDSLDFAEIIKCQEDYDYWCSEYPVNRKCAWLEHWIGSIAKYRGQKIFYPSIGLNNYAIFSWGSYKQGLLHDMNEFPYEQVKEFINLKGGIQYPVDIYI